MDRKNRLLLAVDWLKSFVNKLEVSANDLNQYTNILIQAINARGINSIENFTSLFHVWYHKYLSLRDASDYCVNGSITEETRDFNSDPKFVQQRNGTTWKGEEFSICSLDGIQYELQNTIGVKVWALHIMNFHALN